jgi:hypothetical protein
MAKQAKLNEKVREAVNAMIDAGRWNRSRCDWGFAETRAVLWTIVRDEILSQCQAAPAVLKANPELADWEKFKNAMGDRFMALISDGYMVESSNLGKHLVAEGLASEKAKGTAPSGETYR